MRLPATWATADAPPRGGDSLTWAAVPDLVQPGAQALATSDLRDDGILAGTGDMLGTLVHRVGL